MIFDIFMYPLRHRERERGQIDFSSSSFHVYLLTLFVLFFSLPRTYYCYTNIISPSHHYTSTLVLEQIERHFYVYTHDIIVHLFFSHFNSFGKRTPSNQYRINECVVLEPSEMLVVSTKIYLSMFFSSSSKTEIQKENYL
jgi:hypothetical protein